MLDSGCIQHVTSDSRMFNSINTNDDNGVIMAKAEVLTPFLGTCP